MAKSDLIKWPAHATLKARSSTISNAFVQTFTPWLTELTLEEEKNILEIYKKYDADLGIVKNNELVNCAYCGEKATSADHIFPLVSSKKATGDITEIYNLLPCCSKCNSSKGNKELEEWLNAEERKQDLIDRNIFSEEKDVARKEALRFLVTELRQSENAYSKKVKEFYKKEDVEKLLDDIYCERDKLIKQLICCHKLCEEFYDQVVSHCEIMKPEEFVLRKLKDFAKKYRNKEKVKEVFEETIDELCHEHYGFSSSILSQKKENSQNIKLNTGASERGGSKSKTYTYRYINNSVLNECESFESENVKNLLQYIRDKSLEMDEQLIKDETLTENDK